MKTGTRRVTPNERKLGAPRFTRTQARKASTTTASVPTKKATPLQNSIPARLKEPPPTRNVTNTPEKKRTQAVLAGTPITTNSRVISEKSAGALFCSGDCMGAPTRCVSFCRAYPASRRRSWRPSTAPRTRATRRQRPVEQTWPQYHVESSIQSTERGAQPRGLNTRCVDGGYAASFPAGRRGRGMSSPPQLGQTPFNRSVTQLTQNVHSKVQMRASGESGGRSRSQHSQPGRICSMQPPWTPDPKETRREGAGLHLSKAQKA